MVPGVRRFSENEVVGRPAELSALQELVHAVRAGQGGLVWVEGEPGIGKSTLVGALVRAASSIGCAVLTGAGDELLEAFPLRLMADCLDVSARSADRARFEIADLIAGSSAGSGAADPILAATERMLALVDRLCRDGPVVLVVENLQWADEPSLLVWARLAHAVEQIPLLLVGTCRPIPFRPIVVGLCDLVKERGGTTVSLGPLDPAGSVALAGQVTGSVIGPGLAAELSRAGGNPLYLRELIQALLRDGLVEVCEGVADVHDELGSLPKSLIAAISRRLGFLSSETIDALCIAALLGTRFDVDEWCLAQGWPASDLLPLVEEATAARVLRDTGDHLSFRHELIRQALVEQTPAALRAVLHDKIAHALADGGAALDVVARHLLMGSERVDRWVVGWLTGLADSALRAAPDVSAELLTRATAVLEHSDPLWATMTARLAHLLFWLGRDEPACEATTRVLERTADLEEAAGLRLHAMRSAGRAGRFEDALAIAEVALADEALPPRWRARLGAWAAMFVAHLSRSEEARARARRALTDAEACGDPLGMAYAHHALSYMSATDLQLEHIDAGLAVLGVDSDSIDQRTLMIGDRLLRLAAAGRQAELQVAVSEALVLAERVGMFGAGLLFAQAAGVKFRYGEWDEALVYAGTVSAELMQNPALQYVHGLIASIALRRENRELAQAQLLAGKFLGPRGMERPELIPGFVADALGLREELAGRRAQALTVRAAWLEVPAGLAREARCDEALSLTRLALIVGERRIAEAVVDACVPSLDSPNDFVIAARCCRAMLADDAEELLGAADAYGTLGWTVHRAQALEEAAVRLAKDDPNTAREAFGEAVRGYTDVGATWDVRRMEARLRPWGIRRRPHSVRRHIAGGWDALTPSEVRIAELMARGRSNPDIANELILSRSTVQTHVSSILTKLQLRSRAELVREAARRDGAR